jgi:hypothetical protein
MKPMGNRQSCISISIMWYLHSKLTTTRSKPQTTTIQTRELLKKHMYNIFDHHYIIPCSVLLLIKLLLYNTVWGGEAQMLFFFFSYNQFLCYYCFYISKIIMHRLIIPRWTVSCSLVCDKIRPRIPMSVFF